MPRRRRPLALPPAVTLLLASLPIWPRVLLGQRAAAAETYVQESWTVRDGLPVNSVSALLQGRDGYLWVATHDGLVRFDGVRFTVFNAASSPGLPSNRIARLTEARDGTLWLQTEQHQLVRYRRGAFAPVPLTDGPRSNAVVLREDARGTMWVGTERGLFVARDTHLVQVAQGAIRGRVTAILPRRDGSLVVATGADGIHRVARDRVERLTAPDRLGGDSASSMLEDRDGTLWIGTGRGVWRWALGGRRDGGGALHAALPGLAGHGVELTEAPRAREIWVGTPHGVHRIAADAPFQATRATARGRGDAANLVLADASGRIVWGDGDRLRRDGRLAGAPAGGPAREEVVATLPSEVTSATFDHEGSLWIGTRSRGLYRLKPAAVRMVAHAPTLPATSTYPVLQTRDGAVWYGTATGDLVRVAGGEQRTFRPNLGPTAWIRTLHEDRAGRLWVGGFGRVVVCTPPAMRCGAPPDGGPLSFAGTAMAMHEDPAGAMWVGTDFALYRQEAGRWRRLDARGAAPTAGVRVFLRTRDGALWMGTLGGGVTRYHDGAFRAVATRDGLPSNLVRSLHQDADGWLWLGTEGRGLVRLDPREWAPGKRGRVVAIGAKDGLFDDVVHQILEDAQGRLWFNGNRGISWVERRALTAFADGRAPSVAATSYTERDGMRNREGNGGSQPAGVRARDGTLWFPTQDGVAVIDPARIRRNVAPPPVVVEQVAARGDAGRDLEIAYTAMSFVAPANVRFRYRLAPYDADWVDAGTRRTAFYTRVPPGRYTFRVIASNNDGVWNTAGASTRIDLAPHVWETTAFRLAVLGALGGLTVLAVWWRLRHLRARTAALERVVDARTRELRDRNAQLAELHEARSRLFANLSHELRTPLTLIIGPLEDLHARPEDAPSPGIGGEVRSGRVRHLDMALRNARRLLRLVNQILDVAKLESGHLRLRARRLDLAAFARGIAAAFAPVKDRKRIAFEVVAPAAPLLVWGDPDALEKAITNLLSNAFKFTPDGGRIVLTVASEEALPGARAQDAEGGAGAAIVRVADSGPGIAASDLPHVFERFRQVDESGGRSQPGTGIGLSLTKELVELHGGRVEVASGGAVEQGAVFTLVLPLGRRHLRDDQVVPSDVGPVGAYAPPIDGIGPEAVPVDDGAELPPLAAGESAATEDVPTLLVVDDNADLRGYVRDHFGARYRVVEAGDGEAGIALARQLLPDVVVSDVMMPGTDGFALCRALRSDAETDFLPIVLLTARASTEDRVAGLEGGADDYLGKPFTMRELEARVENLVASRRRLRERFARAARADAGGAADAPPDPGVGVGAADRALVARIRDAIDARLHDDQFGVAELARAVNMDRSHLFRRTRELFGAAPSELVRRARLERAAALLAAGEGGVGDVAYAVGFNSVSYFCRCFREVHGATPAQYRAQPTRR